MKILLFVLVGAAVDIRYMAAAGLIGAIGVDLSYKKLLSKD